MSLATASSSLEVARIFFLVSTNYLIEFCFLIQCYVSFPVALSALVLTAFSLSIHP